MVNSAVVNSAVYEGWVYHRRHLPHAHGFRYRVCMLWLDLGELPGVFADRWLWSVGRRNIAELRRSDYHGDPALPLDEAVRRTVHERLGRRPGGPIRLLAHARYFGHCFNPVSLYYGYAPDGRTLDWVMAEITNTPWRERHTYVLSVDAAQADGRALSWAFDKDFHVSPFVALDRSYRWQLGPPGDALAVRMEVCDAERLELEATLALRRRPLSGRSLSRCLWRYPLMTLWVVTAIYWQALRLWLKRTPVHDHPRTLARKARP